MTIFRHNMHSCCCNPYTNFICRIFCPFWHIFWQHISILFVTLTQCKKLKSFAVTQCDKENKSFSQWLSATNNIKKKNSISLCRVTKELEKNPKKYPFIFEFHHLSPKLFLYWKIFRKTLQNGTTYWRRMMFLNNSTCDSDKIIGSSPSIMISKNTSQMSL